MMRMQQRQSTLAKMYGLIAQEAKQVLDNHNITDLKLKMKLQVFKVFLKVCLYTH